MVQRQWSDVSLDDLYRQLSKEMGGATTRGKNQIDHGKELFQQMWAHVRSSVCNNETVRQLVMGRNSSTADQITLGAVLAAHLNAVLGDAFNVGLIVAIAARLGVKSLCVSQWNN